MVAKGCREAIRQWPDGAVKGGESAHGFGTQTSKGELCRVGAGEKKSYHPISYLVSAGWPSFCGMSNINFFSYIISIAGTGEHCRDTDTDT